MKIIKLLFTILILNLFHDDAYAHTLKGNPVPDSTEIKAKKLKQLYVLSTASSADMKELYQQKFFDEFPTSFKEFIQLYGYDSKTGKGGVLVDEAADHVINLFNSLKMINDTLYYMKIVKISLFGYWEADAVNYFQHGLRNKVLSDPGLILHILNNMKEGEITSFWHFYFDGVHPEKEIAQPLQKIKYLNERIYKLMISAQRQVLTEN